MYLPIYPSLHLVFTKQTPPTHSQLFGVLRCVSGISARYCGGTPTYLVQGINIDNLKKHDRTTSFYSLFQLNKITFLSLFVTLMNIEIKKRS